MDEQTTAHDLRRFLAYLLRKLHLLLLATLLRALLLGGLRGGLDLLADLRQPAAEVDQETIAELQRVIAFNEQLLDEYNHYLAHSLYQNLDATRVTRHSLTAYVRFIPDETLPEAEQFNPGYRIRNDTIILNAYRQVGLTEGAIAALDTLHGQAVERRYYDELISIDVLSDANLVRVTALSDQPELSRRMSETVLDTLHTELNAQLLPHSLTLVRSGSSTVVDSTLRTTQLDMLEKTTRLEADQRRLERQVKIVANPVVDNRFSLQNTLEHGLFGALIALMLALLLLFLTDVLSLRLDDERTLTRRFSCPVLARLPLTGTKTSRLEKWLGRHILGTLEALDPGQQQKLLQAHIRRLLPADRPALLLMTSSLLTKQQLTDLAVQLAAAWTDEKTQTIVRQADDNLSGLAAETCCLIPAESVNHAADAVKLADQLTGCLIIEDLGRSRLPQIERQWTLLQDLKIPLLGCICRCPDL